MNSGSKEINSRYDSKLNSNQPTFNQAPNFPALGFQTDQDPIKLQKSNYSAIRTRLDDKKWR